MTNPPFYFTWNHQPSADAADAFPVKHAEHDEFVLADGRRVYDFLSTSFQTSFGHSHPAIKSAIQNQLDVMPIASPKSTFPLKQQVSQKLLELFDLGPGKIFYTLSGSESVENALKMSRKITGRTKIAARQKSYHGASLGALSVTGDWRNPPHFTIDDHTIRIPEPSDDPAFEQGRQVINAAGPDTVAAIILETISGVNGVVIPSQEWYDAVQSTCRKHGIMLIMDEVLCGFGRTGPAFAFQHYGLKPDLVCTSKGITGGYIPFGAVWTSAKIAEYYDSEKLVCGLTNYAHPLGLAALDAVIDLLRDSSFHANKHALESLFADSMTKLSKLDKVADVRCRGLLAAIDLEGCPAPTWSECFEKGMHLYSKSNMIVVAPPFISTVERLGEALDILKEQIVGVAVA